MDESNPGQPSTEESSAVESLIDEDVNKGSLTNLIEMAGIEGSADQALTQLRSSIYSIEAAYRTIATSLPEEDWPKENIVGTIIPQEPDKRKPQDHLWLAAAHVNELGGGPLYVPDLHLRVAPLDKLEEREVAKEAILVELCKSVPEHFLTPMKRDVEGFLVNILILNYTVDQATANAPTHFERMGKDFKDKEQEWTEQVNGVVEGSFRDAFRQYGRNWHMLIPKEPQSEDS